jgi:hypothetical protein
MRYMFLVYSQEEDTTPEALSAVARQHLEVITESRQHGVFCAADPLRPTSTATTVRVQDGKVLVTDGPFAETKEQLAGYYILDCQNLDEALEWAAKIPTACKGGAGCIEVRPIHEIRDPAFLDA